MLLLFAPRWLIPFWRSVSEFTRTTMANFLTIYRMSARTFQNHWEFMISARNTDSEMKVTKMTNDDKIWARIAEEQKRQNDGPQRNECERPEFIVYNK